MVYEVILSDEFDKQLRKIKSKDLVLYQRISKKLNELSENPEHFKPLKNVLSGYRRVHIDPFVLIFRIEENKIFILYIKHHDEAY